MDPLLKTLQHEIASTIAGLSAEQMSRHPEGKWSAAEVLEHLYLTYTGTIKGFERAAQEGKPAANTPSWRQRGRRLVVLGFSYLPPGRKAPAFTRPKGVPLEKVVAEIGARIAEMDEVIRRSEQLLGLKKKLLDHVILGPLTGPQWRKFHLVHGRHHLKQIDRLKAGS